ncbi:M10 family metallopeptidase C-terminal domain-containing protein [Arsenophonus endosymbiont of Aleurodicus floccissimus]|uniref:M10 family metallopeptidase C-terminal domain-containing protein n=1 Tax=Arsenophonus endosymbiont of Aleurodicus floccissimus TaxID=2152761 RepID=UPI000E6B05FF|nr:M10 family metallopeptidase C-terminal domain-containing protein [Arsenophonus endosymbiont of Aleurodicus floccissimus]
MPNNSMRYGTDKNDDLFGSDSNDMLFGNNGDDKLSGGKGNDILFGGCGNDHLFGDSGNDNLYGDKGADRLTGGEGNDTFNYLSLDDSLSESPDTITDFEMGKDKIDISTLNIDSDDNFTAIQLVDHFTHRKNEMLFSYSEQENLTKLMLDHDGNGIG